jgi:hypothetical protein
MFNQKNKKSQLFVIDLTLSFVILIITLGIVFSYYQTVTSNDGLIDTNKKITKELTRTKINDLNDDYIKTLFISGEITNPQNSIAQQTIQFYGDGRISEAKNLIKIIVEKIISNKINLAINLYDKEKNFLIELYKFQNPSKTEFKNSESASVYTREIFTYKNVTKYYGPYILEISLWD